MGRTLEVLLRVIVCSTREEARLSANTYNGISEYILQPYYRRLESKAFQELRMGQATPLWIEVRRWTKIKL